MWKVPAWYWVPVATALRVFRFRIEERPLIWRVAANILNKKSRTADKGWFSNLGFWGRCLYLLTVKTYHVTSRSKRPGTWADPLVQHKQRKKDMKFGNLNVRSLYRLRWIFRKWDVGAWTGSIWLMIETGSGHECGNEPSGSKKKCG